MLTSWGTRFGLLATALIVSGAGSSPEEQLLALDKAWVEAEVKHERKAIERILDEKLLVTFGSGKTTEREEFIAAILSEPVAPYEVVHDLVQVFRDTAIVVDHFGTGLKANVTWVAIRRNGQWRVIAETFSSVKAETK